MQPTSIKAPFLEQFTDDWSERWTPSEATKKTPVGSETFSYVGKWEVEDPSEPLIEGDKGLVAKTKAAHHAISAPFEAPIHFSDKPLVVQYEVKYQKGGNCGGGYLKLLENGFQTAGKEFDDKTPWTIMFGPDMTCPGTKVRSLVDPNCGRRVLTWDADARPHISIDPLHLPPQEPHYWRIRGEASRGSSQAFN